jgi:hypothetical protein
VFFEAMRWPWEYEPEGFWIARRGYLPDFRLADRFILEVKPLGWLDRDGHDPYYDNGEALLAAGHDFFVVVGEPGNPEGFVWSASEGWHVGQFAECRRCGRPAILGKSWARMGCRTGCGAERWPITDGRILDAIARARGARFEHGESP